MQMQVTIERNKLLEAVQAVASALQERTPKPVLQSMHVDVSEQAATVSATDLQIAIRYTVEARRASASGQGLVHGTRLSGLLRDSAAEEVTLSFEGARTKLCAGRSVFKLVSQDVSEYPQLPTFGKATLAAKPEDLCALIRRTVFAVASEQGRYAIDGVALTADGEKLELAGTDGRRLSVARCPLTKKGTLKQVIVPPKMLSTVRKLAEGKASVQLAVAGGLLLARSENVVVAGSLIEARFPKYQEMIPQPSANTLRLSTATFSSALRQAGHLTSEESRAVTFRIAPSLLRIESQSAAIGEASIEVEAAYEGEPMDLAFNARFLLDVIAEFAGGEISIELERGKGPAVIRGDEFVYVVAPVRVREPEANDQQNEDA